LLQELGRRGWSDTELAKVAGDNLLRVLSQAEAVSARLRSERPPSQATIAELDATAAPKK
jgi:membrane dipeptidase